MLGHICFELGGLVFSKVAAIPESAKSPRNLTCPDHVVLQAASAGLCMGMFTRSLTLQQRQPCLSKPHISGKSQGPETATCGDMVGAPIFGMSKEDFGSRPQKVSSRSPVVMPVEGYGSEHQLTSKLTWQVRPFIAFVGCCNALSTAKTLDMPASCDS